MTSAVESAVQRFGKLDILVNNAGIVARGTLKTQPRWSGTG